MLSLFASFRQLFAYAKTCRSRSALTSVSIKNPPEGASRIIGLPSLCGHRHDSDDDCLAGPQVGGVTEIGMGWLALSRHNGEEAEMNFPQGFARSR